MIPFKGVIGDNLMESRGGIVVLYNISQEKKKNKMGVFLRKR